MNRLVRLASVAVCVITPAATWAADEKPAFRAGASAIDVSPTKLPVIVNGNFFAVNAERVVDPLHARALVLDDGATKLALCVVDSCVIPRELADRMKALAQKASGIPAERIMISATHTHSAPSLMQAHASDIDPYYPELLTVKVVEAIQRAHEQLQPAEVGWTVVDDYEHTHCRQWIYRPDKVGVDPFGQRTVRANMHPGHQNPDCIGPEGPVDPGLTLLAVRSLQGRPIAVLANYSMHYFGAQAVSADYFGHFAAKIAKLVAPDDTQAAPVVGIMSQGTSGDLMWPDYGQPATKPGMENYAEAVAQVALAAYRKIEYRRAAPLAMRERELALSMRVPDAARLEQSRKIVADLKGGPPKTLPDIYAREQLFLHEHPERQVKLQAIRVGDLGIVAIPCEVFGITGLKIKAQSPLVPTMNIELANGEDGYIPPPELHGLGGYTTWACRTAGLETTAEPKIVEAVLSMLEEVSGKPRRKVTETHGPYAKAVLDSRPLAYWRLSDWTGTTAHDATGNNKSATFEAGTCFYLNGPASDAFSGSGTINRCIHLAGARLAAQLPELKPTYTAEWWFWNGLPNDARGVTGHLFARGNETDSADQLSIGGTASAPGKLFYTPAGSTTPLVGQQSLAFRTWNHIALVRNNDKISVYLNGNPQPEITGTASSSAAAGPQFFFGGRHDRADTLEGKIDEVAIYDRALTPAEIAAHYKAAKMPKP